ncbi:MAG: hypothetical protein V1735_08105 [Nanoarchaeota archaeon]
MDEGFEMLRSERRSFFCPNKLWKEMEKHVDCCMSVSTFIKQAIVEKMIREEPEKEELFHKLLN